MISQHAFSRRKKTIVGGLCLLAVSCAFGQTPQRETTGRAVYVGHTVPLVSGSCPAVHGGDAISLDWNPAFDPSWAVTGMKNVSLSFEGLMDDGVTVNPRRSFFLPRSGGHKISSMGNGYFHIESPLPLNLEPGIYQLVDAYANPELLPDYQGEIPKPTVFPVREHFCITVIATAQP